MKKGKRVLAIVVILLVAVVAIVAGIKVFNWVSGLGDSDKDPIDDPDDNQTVNKPPIARLQVSKTALMVGEAFYVSGNASRDPDNSNETGNGIMVYHFDYGDGETAEGPNANYTYSYAQPGNYTITMRVYDTLGASDEDSVKVKVVWQDTIIQPNTIITVGDPVLGFLNSTAEVSWEVKSEAKIMTLSITIAGASNPLEERSNKVNVTLEDPRGQVMENATVEVLGNKVIEWEYGEEDLSQTGTYMLIFHCTRGGAMINVVGEVSYI